MLFMSKRERQYSICERNQHHISLDELNDDPQLKNEANKANATIESKFH